MFRLTSPCASGGTRGDRKGVLGVSRKNWTSSGEVDAEVGGGVRRDVERPCKGAHSHRVTGLQGAYVVGHDWVTVLRQSQSGRRLSGPALPRQRDPNRADLDDAGMEGEAMALSE
jgi:hypothetical protein